MFGGTHQFTVEVQLTAQSKKDYDSAIALIEERLWRVVKGKEIRIPMHPLSYSGHGTQLAVIVRASI